MGIMVVLSDLQRLPHVVEGGIEPRGLFVEVSGASVLVCSKSVCSCPLCLEVSLAMVFMFELNDEARSGVWILHQSQIQMSICLLFQLNAGRVCQVSQEAAPVLKPIVDSTCDKFCTEKNGHSCCIHKVDLAVARATTSV